MSPMERCATKARIAGCVTVPVAAKTSMVDNERKKPIEIHTNGNTTAGGVHDGRFFCFLANFSFATRGLDALSGENTRLRNDNAKNITATIVLANPRLLACKPLSAYFCTALRHAAIAPASNAVAATYLAAAAPSKPFPSLAFRSLMDAYARPDFPRPSLKDTSPALATVVARLARVVVVFGRAFARVIVRVIIVPARARVASRRDTVVSAEAVVIVVAIARARGDRSRMRASATTTTTTTASASATGALARGARCARATRGMARARALGKTARATGARCATARASATASADVVNVDLGDRSYPIYIGSGLLDDGEALRAHVAGSTALVVTNETIAGLGYLDRAVEALRGGDGTLRVETVVLPDGEEHKNLDVLNMVYTRALETRLDRGTTFVALGGGVIGDMTGYAAASYQRGVKFVQIPTTVMAMVDSSVGGKTGVNHALGKNMIGAFYQPECVLIDIDSLKTLPDREFASGIAEVVKYGLIRDGAFFEWLEANVDKLLARDASAIAYAVERSCVNKAEVVAADEKEGGVRATLNLGHTFGHAIETGLGYGEWLHGEAVSAGMCMAADMSVRLGWIDESLKNRTIDLLNKCNTPIDVPDKMTTQMFMDLMAVDKKAANGKLRLILLKGPLGECVFTGDFDQSKLTETLEAYVK
mgnify:CR=1 FL=1